MPPDIPALLAPLVARVLELGRGPPALVRWVGARLGRGASASELAARLAREFARTGETLPPAPGSTHRARERPDDDPRV